MLQILLALFLTSAAAPATQTASPAPVNSQAKMPICQALFKSQASHKARSAALTLAIRDWKSKVSSQYGKSYNMWSITRNRKIKCMKNAAGFSCEIQGRPCRTETISKPANPKLEAIRKHLNNKN